MLRIVSESVAKEKEKQAGNKQQERVYDAAGNKIDLKKVTALSDKLGLCAGGETAGAGPSTVPCPRRALGETHRSAVSVCRRGDRPASDWACEAKAEAETETRLRPKLD